MKTALEALNASVGGMGAVAPMTTGRRLANRPRRGKVLFRAYLDAARHEKQKAPASATNTPEAVTNIQEGNADGTNSRT
jgi:hypothetical protein